MHDSVRQCLIDKSMVKSYNMNLRGNMKIIQKLRPVGNVFRNVADVQTKIDVKLELYLGREPMAQKEHMKEQGATTRN